MQIHAFERGLKALRRLLSRNAWSLRLLRLPKSEPSAEPGLVLIQIDGLARPQLESALRRGRMPFLNSLLQSEGYQLHSLYSGLPSTTPAAQGELFYGRPGAVPAFGYSRRHDGALMHMLKAECAGAIEKELELAGEPLLKSGSCYANIYTGGAAEPHFCASRLTLAHLLRRVRPWGVFTVVILNFAGILRLLALLAVEALLAGYDAVRGSIARREYGHEFLFLFSRVLVCVGLREIITAMSCLDVTRGLPVVQVNFNGYDEQAHRRGPSSAFAHFALYGIDRSLRRIFSAAHRSTVREYEVWIHSDHGQEAVTPFLRLRGKTLAQVVARIVDSGKSLDVKAERQLVRSQDPTGQRLEELLLRFGGSGGNGMAARKNVTVAALGPVAHVYLPATFTGDADTVARKLVEVGAPAALLPLEDGTVKARTSRGSFILPRDAEEVLGAHHPFAAVCAADLAALCHHPDAGDIVLCGWRPKGKSVTFAFENGAHGGPGSAETHAFALLPEHCRLTSVPGPARHLDLREEARRFLHGPGLQAVRKIRGEEGQARLRVMTYNVHGLRGMDGRVSADRIARIIAARRPDVIALQECYEGSGHAQLKALKNRLIERYHYPADLQLLHDGYGNGLLSTVPLLETWRRDFPSHQSKESRGALGAVLEWNRIRLRICNTHFGLLSRERLAQAEMLRAWLFPGNVRDEEPLILAGDFNAGPNSPSMKLLNRDLLDVQISPMGLRPRNTFFGRLPVRRIDHIFVSPSLHPGAIQVPRTHLTRMASDHLPLLADLHPAEYPAASL